MVLGNRIVAAFNIDGSRGDNFVLAFDIDGIGNFVIAFDIDGGGNSGSESSSLSSEEDGEELSNYNGNHYFVFTL